jgi:hypothetical protein
VTDSQGKPLASSSPPTGSYGPVQFHDGYNLPCSVGAQFNEASSNSLSNLAAAVKEAAKLRATEISNSYGGSESSGETSYDSSYNHSGVAVTASSGDGGYGVEYPSASRYVVAVGDTTLHLTSSNTYSSERAWSSAGSGCSSNETANSLQTSVSDWSQTGCGPQYGSRHLRLDKVPGASRLVSGGWHQSGLSAHCQRLCACRWHIQLCKRPAGSLQQLHEQQFA